VAKKLKSKPISVDLNPIENTHGISMKPEISGTLAVKVPVLTTILTIKHMVDPEVNHDMSVTSVISVPIARENPPAVSP